MNMTEERLLQAILRNDFRSFIAKAFQSINPGTRYLPNWHIDLIAEYLEAARAGEINRLVINMPPRALKSLCVSVAWPAWLLGKNPTSRIMAASYAQPLSLKHSLDSRAILQSGWYRRLFPGVRLTHDQNEKHKFITTARGFRLATSVGGVATGEGGNFLIVDDPMSPLQATNKIWREHVNTWFDQTFATRLDDKQRGVMILVMQRLHHHDLSGYLLDKGGWEHLCLPMIADRTQHYQFHDVDYTMQEGELLHPMRDTQATIERLRQEIGSHAFASQYQQQPLPEEGRIVKAHWFGRYDDIPDPVVRTVQSWDTAIKSGNQHDASVCMTVKETASGAYIQDVLVIREEYPSLKKIVSQLADIHLADAVLIEDKASGQQLIQDLRRESSLPIIPVMPKGDKITRFSAVSALIEAGRIYLPRQARWLARFEAEILEFPYGSHDDQVDALSQYLGWLRQRRMVGARIREL